MVLTIYDKNGDVKCEVVPNDSSTQQHQIQGDNVLALSFTYYDYLPLDVGDYTEFMGGRYWLTERFTPKQNTAAEWVYDIHMYGIESLLSRFLVLNNDEPVFVLTAPPKEHVKIIAESVNNGMAGATLLLPGMVNGTANVTIDYKGKYCADALRELAQKLEDDSEWWLDGQEINVCRCLRGDELTLGYGKGLLSLDRDTSNTYKFYTRLFPIGSTRNINAEDYGHTRLMLPEGKQYVELHTDEYGVYDHFEQEAFSYIYPRYTGTITGVRTEEQTDSNGGKFTVYYIADADIPFNPNDYELPEEVKRISFQSGELDGQGTSDDHYFEANWHEDKKEWEIITQWPDDYDGQLPGGTLIPKEGDTYIPWNISMPQEYYALAEAELAVAVDKYNERHWQDIAVYKAPTDHVWLEDQADKGVDADIYIGRRIRLESEKYFPVTGYRSSRITRLSRKVCYPTVIDIEISDAVQQGALDRINDSINDLKNTTHTVINGESQGNNSGGDGTGCVLMKDIVTMTAVGFIPKGTTIKKGTTCEDIFRQMFLTVTKSNLTSVITHGDGSHANDVEYGTIKGYIDYTAMRNDAGVMESAVCDDGTTAIFSQEDSTKKQTWRRLLNPSGNEIYTATESYTLTVVYGKNASYPTGVQLTNTCKVNVRRRWFVGGSDTVPDDTWDSDKVRALGESGLLASTSFTALLPNGYGRVLVIAVPATYTIESCKCQETNNSDISTDTVRFKKLETQIQVDGANGSQAIGYNVYYYEMDLAVTDKRTYNITLK